MQVTRRQFVATSAAATLMAGLPARWTGGAWADDSPETPKVRIGIIALTDCSSIVMAHELGLFKKHGIESTISKEASWAVIRDRLTLGENQATHLLLGIPYAATMGLQGSPVKPMVIPMYINRNGQAITLTRALLDKGVKTPPQLKPLALEAKAKGTPMTFAMTYPPGTHAMWMRYWLASGGLNPDRDVTLITIPPAQMVANMKVGAVDAFCVGEPWNEQLVNQDIGYTALTTGELWLGHPEKILGMRADWVDAHPKATLAILMATMEAQQWCEKLENKAEMAEIIGRRQWFNVPVADIIGRLQGDINYGNGRTARGTNLQMKFWGEKGRVSYPWKSLDAWFITENIRWGKFEPTIDVKALVDKTNRSDLWREAAKALGLASPPTGDSRGTETFFDGKVFDPADPQAYLKSLGIKRIA